MGVTFSCPLAAYFDLDNAFDSAIVKSLSCKNDFHHHHHLSGNFKIQDSESKLFESLLDSGKMLNEEDQQLSGYINKQVPKMPILNSSSPKHEAAIKLQKVYKSFRTRRKLADCAVLIEQSWWKLLDFAELKHSSISFFDLDKHESAISRWSRARTRAAKVGKGLSKNCKAQKLALQHWLEAIDPRHRYGHNLHFYYMNWLHSQSKEPFFYWLDIGEGKEVNLIEKCPRTKLQQQCIKYLGPMERKAYEVAVEDGKLFYKQTGEFLDTSEEPKAKWIFVLSTTRTLYVSKKKKGSFQHSSFLAGGATLAAGRMVVDHGVLKAVWPHSGHYRPTPENFQDFILFLKENNVDLSDVKLDCADEDEDSFRRAESSHLRSNSSDEDLEGKDGLYTEDNYAKESTLTMNNSTKVLIPNAMELAEPKPLIRFGSKLTNLQIPSKEDFIERLKNENQEADLEDDDNSPPDSPVDEHETGEEEEEESFAYEKIPNNHSVKGLKETQVVEASLSEDSILERINSVKGSSSSNSYQLGKQLSCKWSTGAGPRIGCVREYPSELQCHALEQVNLSPRSARSLKLIIFPSESLTPTRRLSPLGSSSLNQISKPCRTRSSPLCT